VLTEQHDREARGAQSGQGPGVEPHRVEHHAVHPPGAGRHAEQGELAGPGPAGLVDQDGVATPAGQLDDLVGELREVRRGDLGDEQVDDAGAPLPQAAGQQVGLVVQLVERGLHLGAHGRRHVVEAVHHVGHRAGGDTGVPGDVAQRHGHDVTSRSAWR
jgi:hypothetical protein